jgi:hypothetical protein
MTDIYVAKVSWSGTYGHLGVSRFAFVSADGGVPTNTQRDGVLTAINTMLLAAAASIPADVSWVLDPIVESFDGVLGTITGELPAAGAVAPGSGTGGGAYANGVGLTIKWKTGGMFRGRRIQGRTFIVPLDGNQFGTDGRVRDDTAAAWQGFANAYITACAALAVTPLVWGRPHDVKATARTPAHHNPGHWAYIATAIVNSVPAILGRRR